ncbi:MAG: hypothetical protein OEX01_09630 [Candidatus Bathyarchaeota archaeon]|nr:hypothetical protein [Candidatus Bathyarchaeota archaeon]
MKYAPEIEVKVFQAVKELGEATQEEITAFLKKHLEIELDSSHLRRYLRRWKAKKVFAFNYIKDQEVIKLADIPPWYASGIMALVTGSTNETMQLEMEKLNDRLKTQGRIVQPRSVWGDFKTFEVIFETIDPILGGRLDMETTDGNGSLQFPRNSGMPFVPMNWLKGWLRSNAGLVDLPQAVCYHTAWSNGEFLEIPTFEHKTLTSRRGGVISYEAIPKKTQFKAILRFPFRGCKITSEKQLKEWLKLLEVAPLRGLGANPFAFGGRVKLVEIKEIA